MEVARAGEMLIRPMLPCLAPAACRRSGAAAPPKRIAAITRHCRAQQQLHHTSRAFSTSLRRPADDASQAQKQPPKTPSAASELSSVLDSALDFTNSSPTTSTGRNSRFASNNAQAQARSIPSQSGGPPGTRATNSFDDMLSFMSQTPPSRTQQQPTRSDAVSRALSGSGRAPPPSLEKPGLKLDSTIGRKVYVNKEKGFDVARAFRSMEIMVARNGVRRDFNKQRFHERGGTKRKRLKSERWRKNFKEGFRAVVRKVLKMRKQGW